MKSEPLHSKSSCKCRVLCVWQLSLLVNCDAAATSPVNLTGRKSLGLGVLCRGPGEARQQLYILSGVFGTHARGERALIAVVS
jgi:hypothetical protein